ncbi:MAG: hypothetical protein GY702_03525 [Desulfobulbaceae bacterium]|nr:hypothetical protein [Desulfobulbaceae bacterium]
MWRRKTISLLLLLMVFGASGCYIKQVRHLAADVALIKVGESSQEDVLIFLGDPDEQVEQENGVVKWLYRETDMTLMEKTPLIGDSIGSPENILVVVTFTGGVVVDTLYQASDEDDMDWADDFSWQQKKN